MHSPVDDPASTRHYRVGLEHFAGDRLELARQAFTEAIELNPGNAKAHNRLGEVLLELGQIAQATHHQNLAYGLTPDDVEIAVSYAAFLERDYRREQAETIVKRLLAQGHQSARLIKSYVPIAQRNKTEIQALEIISGMLGSDGISLIERSSLRYAAANLLDGLGRYDEAFENAQAAGELRGGQYDARNVERVLAEWSRYFTRPRLRSLPHATHGSEVPVFVVGMPRSGTTLVEQILASHPQVYGAGELRWIFNIYMNYAQKNAQALGSAAHGLDTMSIQDLDDLAEQYLQPLIALSPNSTRIINKLPGNLFYLGLIQLLFPASKVIYCRRDPLDTCISCFLTEFDKGNNFSLSLDSVGHYARHNELMMSHWKNVLSLPMLEVQYERMVASVESETRRLLDFLELPWDDYCLRFYENRRYVATSSHTQVRRPIYQNSVGRWHHYERHLAPLKAALRSDQDHPTSYSANDSVYGFAEL